MTHRVEGDVAYSQTFDVENRLSAVQTLTGTTTFAYDGDGTLVQPTRPDSSVTVYMGVAYGILISSTGVTTSTSYYNALMARAMRVTTSTGSSVYYVLADQLGSAIVMLDSRGRWWARCGTTPLARRA